MSDYTPVPKIQAVGVAGAIAVVLAFVASVFGIVLDAPTVAALTTLFNFAAGYFTKDGGATDE